jgi:hypothetical protein
MSQADLAGPLKEIFGKGFGPMLAVLQTDFAGLGQMMKRLGLIMDTETAVSLDMIGDAFSMLANIIVSQLGPAMLWLAETLFKAFGKLVAAPAGGLGAGTAKMGAGEAIVATAKASGIGIAGLFKRYVLGESEEDIKGWIKGKMGAAGFDVKALEAATKTSEETWLGPLEELKKKIAEAAERLKTPVKPTYAGEDESKAPKVKLAKDSGGDALVRVGNFLGSNRNVLENLAQQQVGYLRRIATAVERNAMGGTGDTEFPP